MITYGLIAYLGIIVLVIGYYMAWKTGADQVNPEPSQPYNDLAEEQQPGKQSPIHI